MSIMCKRIKNKELYKNIPKNVSSLKEKMIYVFIIVTPSRHQNPNHRSFF